MKVKSAILFLAFISIFSLEKTYSQEHVEWIAFEDLEEALKTEPRLVIIDIYTTWCGPCKSMYKYTYGNESIAKYLNEKFYALKLDAEEKRSINFKGNEFKWRAGGRSGINELALAITNNKLKSYPTTVFLTEDFQVIQMLPGYMKPPQFEPIIKYFGEKAFKDTPWDEYQKNFESSL